MASAVLDHRAGLIVEARDLLGRDGLLSPRSLTEAFGVTQPQLAETAGLSRDAVSKSDRVRSPATQRRLRDLVEIVARVAPWAGGVQQALAWYRATPIPALGDQTAEAVVKAGHAAAVRDYLDAIAAGAQA
jgi:transcription elongation factor